jgi:predicted phage terminase large subunit-like protein
VEQVVKPYTPHPPSPPQKTFLELDCEEALYGGAAGGGKSDALLMAALQYVDVPGYSAGIFRLTEEELNKPDSILFRARLWFGGTAARWNEKSKAFEFPTTGAPATIHFGYGASMKSLIDRYSGPSFQFIGVDELTRWRRDMYLFLFSRLRGVGLHLPLRMRAATNPPQDETGTWVKERFVAFSEHRITGQDAREAVREHIRGVPISEPRVFESPPSQEAIDMARKYGRQPQGAYFVPAFLDDNPGMSEEERVNYKMNLAKMDPVERAKLENGDWDAVASGDFFKLEWFGETAYLDEEPNIFRPIRYWDLAATRVDEKKKNDPDYSAGALVGIDKQKTGDLVVIAHMERFREDSGITEARVRAVGDLDGQQVKVWFEEEGGSAGKNNTRNFAAKVFGLGWRVEGHRKTGSKSEYWKPLSSAARNGLLRLVRGDWNRAFVVELCGLRADMTHAHDDQADASSGALSILTPMSDLQRLRAWRR